jgi:hypothetical protein
MNRHHRKFLQFVLILIAVVGPLQAQTLFACSMMNRVMDECCCDNHQTGEDCVNSDCEAAVESSEGRCCERSVEVNVDEDARQDTQIVKPQEIRTDVDPPQAMIVPLDVIAAPQERAVLDIIRPRSVVRYFGSDTYLITQRLRI